MKFVFDVVCSGAWGQGIYFASEASYCDAGKYYYTVPSGELRGHRQLFLALVLTGRAALCEPDQTRRMPPVKPKSSQASAVSIEDRFDSVACDVPLSEGKTTRNFVLYDNGRAYPTYLITYFV